MAHWAQTLHEWAACLGWPGEAFLRLALAMVAGGLVGMEREVRGRVAGFRTNILVCVGCALVVLVSTEFARIPFRSVGDAHLSVDPARIAYGVMAGIGFLGAGAILKNQHTVQGLTTAAGIWCVATIGLSLGLGMYSIGLFATILVVTVLWLLDYVESLFPKVHYIAVSVRRPWTASAVEETLDMLGESALSIREVDYERSDDLRHVTIHATVSVFRQSTLRELEKRIESTPEWDLVAMRNR